MSGRATVLLLGGPHHGQTTDVDPDRDTFVSFPVYDPPEGRLVGTGPVVDVTVTKHDYRQTRFVDLDGAMILVYVHVGDPWPLRSLFPGSDPLTVVDHRDRHPSFHDWRRETPRTDPVHHCDICSGTGRDYLGRPCRRHGDPR